LTDIAQPEHTDQDRVRTRPGDAVRVVTTSVEADEFDEEEEIESKEDYSPELLGQTLVSEWMSDRVVAVSPDASLRTVCRALIDGDVHRVFVTEKGKLLGVVSAMDVVRLLAGRPS
jgi:predicted transcriptional regulator